MTSRIELTLVVMVTPAELVVVMRPPAPAPPDVLLPLEVPFLEPLEVELPAPAPPVAKGPLVV